MSILSRAAIATATLALSSFPLLGTFVTQSGPTTTATTRGEADSDAPALDAPALRAAYALPPDQWPSATWDDSIPAADRHELGLVPAMEYPADNPYSAAKVQLGWELFYDPRLSGSKFVACVSCHHPDTGWADSKVTSQGHQLQPLDRNAPTLMGVGFSKHLMWDGRADSLEDQALLPLANAKEMHGDFDEAEKAINAIPEYRAAFKEVFGEEKITIQLIAKAIATFQRTIVPGRSRFDSFLRGKTNLMSDAEIRGLHLFRTKARCINCHNGPMMTDGQFHNVGLTYYGRKLEDLGRYNETHDPKDVGKFKTPTVRNIGRSSPFMHNGLFELNGLMNLYNAGMPDERAPEGDPLAPRKSLLLKRLMLTPQEKSDVMEFLRDALQEPRLRVRAPKIPGMYGEATTTTSPAEEPEPAVAP